MLRATATSLSGCMVTCIIRRDILTTFSDCPHYKFKETQAEQSEPRDSIYLEEGVFAEKPISYAKKSKVDKAALARELENAGRADLLD
jgi:hypothetical protein